MSLSLTILFPWKAKQKYTLLSLCLSFSRVFSTLFNIELDQYIGLLYALSYFWSKTGSIRVLLLSFHPEVTQIQVRCFFGAIQCTSMEQVQSLIFLNEVETNKNWQFPCSEFLCWAFWHAQNFSLWGTWWLFTFHIYFYLRHKQIQLVPVSTNLQGKLLEFQALLYSSLLWVMDILFQLYYSKKNCKYFLYLELLYM